MITYGLTGGIGMGKSTAERLLRERGVAVVDTDAIAHRLVEPGQPALAEIVAEFGAGMMDADGRLRRRELARIVFAEAAARKKLEGILHPRIRQIWQAQLENWRIEGRANAVVVIPLLYETDAAACFDFVICLACSAASQRERLRARGWDDPQIDQRLAAQMPVGEKINRAHYVVWTEGELEVHAAQLARIIS